MDTMKSAQRVLHILEAFSVDHPEYTAAELIEKLSFPQGSIYRFLRILLKNGFLEKNPRTNKFRLGIKMFELGSVVWREMELRKIALPSMEELSRKTGETVHLGVLDGNEVVSIEGMESGQSLRTSLPIGKRVSLHSTGIGKAILSFLSAQWIEKFVTSQRLPQYTSNTITTREHLLDEIEITRQRGYAVDNEENEPGIRCVAAPIRNFSGTVIASMSISGPSFRISKDRIPEFADLVMAICNDISHYLGYRKKSTGQQLS